MSTHRVDGKPKEEEEEEEESHHIYIKTDSCRERRQGCQFPKIIGQRYFLSFSGKLYKEVNVQACTWPKIKNMLWQPCS